MRFVPLDEVEQPSSNDRELTFIPLETSEVEQDQEVIGQREEDISKPFIGTRNPRRQVVDGRNAMNDPRRLDSPAGGEIADDVAYLAEQRRTLNKANAGRTDVSPEQIEAAAQAGMVNRPKAQTPSAGSVESYMGKGLSEQEATANAAFDAGISNKLNKPFKPDADGDRIAVGYRPDLEAERVANEEASLTQARDAYVDWNRFAKLRDYAEENPVAAGLASSFAGGLSVLNAPQAIVNSVLELGDSLEGVMTGEKGNAAKLPKWGWTEELGKLTQAALPEVARVDLTDAWGTDQFGSVLAAKLAGNSLPMFLSLASMLAPPLRAVLLPTMGSLATGSAYSQGDSALASVAKGAIEVGTEMLPLRAFDAAMKGVLNLSAPARDQIFRLAGQKALEAGTALTINGLTGAIEEAVAQVGGNAVDRYMQGKNTALSEGVADAALLGGITGKILSIPAVSARAAEPVSRESVAARALADELSGRDFDPATATQAADLIFGTRSVDGSGVNRVGAALVEAERAKLNAMRAKASEDLGAAPDVDSAIAAAEKMVGVPTTGPVEEFVTAPAVALNTVVPTPDSGTLESFVQQTLRDAPAETTADAAAVNPNDAGAAAAVRPVDVGVGATVSQPAGVSVADSAVQQGESDSADAVDRPVYSLDPRLVPVSQRAPDSVNFAPSLRVVAEDNGRSTVQLVQTPERAQDDQQAVEQLRVAVNRYNPGDGDRIQPFRDFNISDSARGRLDSLLGQFQRIAFVAEQALGVRLRYTQSLNGYGVAYKGNVFIDIPTVLKGDGKNQATGIFLFTAGHEGFHHFETSKNPEDQRVAANFKAVLRSYIKDGAVDARQAFESDANIKAGGKAVTRAYAESEVMADINGAMFIDPEFWGRLYQIDNGSTFRKVLYRMMQSLTKIINAAKKSRLDVSDLVKDVAAVREAAAQAWAQRANNQTPPAEIADDVVQYSQSSEAGANTASSGYDVYRQSKQDTENAGQTTDGQRGGDRGRGREAWRPADRQVAAPEQADAGARRLEPLPGAPAIQGFTGPDPRLVQVAEDYALRNGIELRRQAEFVEVDPERARRIASAYESMPHAPQDPKVKEAYDNLIRQTTAQYRALENAGYRFWFMDMGQQSSQEYASSPWNAMRDIRANKQMGVYPTEEGFGSDAQFDPSENPLLADTGIQWPSGSVDGPLKRVLANDLFRAVHDAFGHGLEGAGFRARGEENAWQAHVRLFTGSAIGAITSETRGQNSWLNYGPHGEKNRLAKVEDTIFADQKTGLMPEWTWTEGRAGDMPAYSRNGQSNFEVAPDPNNELLSAKWNALDLGDKLRISRTVADKIVPQVLALRGASGKIVEQTGSYLNDTNPSFALLLESGDLQTVSKDLGFVLSQDSMMNISTRPFAGGSKVGAVVISIGDKSFAETKIIYDTIRSKVPEVGGQSFAEGEMVVLNYSDTTTSDLASKIDDALDKLYTVRVEEVYSSFPEKKDYDYASAAIDTGEPSQAGPDIRQRLGGIRAEATRLIEAELPNFSRAGEVAGPAEPAGRPGDSTISDQQRGAPSVLAGGRDNARAGGSSDTEVRGAIHYGKLGGLSQLNGASFGSGIKGAEQERLNQPGTDHRIKKRVYFYLPVTGGIAQPEIGLGAHVYSGDLSGLYDTATGKVRGSGNAFETAVLDAGYRGYINREQGTAVVLNENVPVKYLGTADKFIKVTRTPTVAKPRQMTRVEGDELVRRPEGQEVIQVVRAGNDLKFAAPSFKMQWGEARVLASEAAVADQVLKDAGSTFQFGEPQFSRDFVESTDDINDLGAFNIDTFDFDANTDEVVDGDAMADIANELSDMGFGVKGVVASDPTDWKKVSDKQLKGITPETAFPVPEFAENEYGNLTAPVYAGGTQIRLELQPYGLKSADGEDLWTAATGGLRIEANWGYPLSMRGTNRAEAVGYLMRMAAAKELNYRKFDFYKAVPAAAAKRIGEFWSAVPDIPGATEFAAGTPEVDGNSAEKLRQVAKARLLGKGYSVQVNSTADFFFMYFNNEKTGDVDEASIQIIGKPRDVGQQSVVLHAVQLNKGSGVGKMFYSIANTWANLVGVKVMADPDGLTAVNSVRRTENALSAAARTKGEALIEPGWAQRVYGFDGKAKTPDAKRKNLTRIALAQARNVYELAPDFQGVRYDLDTQTFVNEDGSSADAKVKGIMSRPEIRRFSLGRTSFIRAALTNELIDGEIALPEEMGEPIMYSRTEQTETPEFKKWFGLSKVVDADGKPLVVYHGTAADVTFFDKLALGESTGAKSARSGFFFAASPKVASGYAMLSATRPALRNSVFRNAAQSDVLPPDLKKMLLDASEQFSQDDLRESEWINEAGGGVSGANVLPVYLSIQNPMVVDYGGKEYRERKFADVIAEAKTAGHDGVVFRNAEDSAHKQYSEVTDIFVAFDPTQIKSAIGNNGQFDPENPDIRYSRVARATSDLMQMSDEEARKSLGLKTKGNVVRDIAKALNRRTVEQFGVIPDKDTSDASAQKLAKAMAVEVKYQLGTTADTGTGLGWYSSNYPRALDRLGERFPELKASRPARAVFTALVAVTSNGEKVNKNIKNAVELYEYFRMGKPLVAMGNRRASALENNLAQIEDLIDRHGIDGFERHLMGELTVAQMNAELRARGEKADGSYTADTMVPRAAVYFGPKLGAFYANLMGSEGYLTMDLWWTRTVNRMRGLLIPKATSASLRKFANLSDRPDMTDEEVIAAVVEPRNRYEEYGWTTQLEFVAGSKEPSKSVEKEVWFIKARRAAGDAFDAMLAEHQIEKMANTIYKNEYEMLEEAPFRATDRSFMYEAARKTQGMLRADGIDLTLADIQAALWYYEKRLYQKLSGRKADDIGYEEAILSQAAESAGPARPSPRFSRVDGGGPVSERTSQEDFGVRGSREQARPGDGEDAERVAFSRAQPRQGQTFTLPGEGLISQQRRVLQDYFLPMLEVQQAIVSQGGSITEQSDVYRAEERMYGRVEETLRDFRKREFDPLIQEASDNDITMDELSLYAYAKHAKERNAYIQTLRNDMPDTGSGLSNDEADDILTMFQVNGQTAIMERLHQRLMAITAATRREMLESELITQDEYDHMESQYENYVPLRGFEEVDQDGERTSVQRGGRGFNIRGKETTRALGRRTRAGNIIENIVLDYERAVFRGERNMVGQAFLELIRTNPDPKLWEIDAERTRTSFNRQTGRVNKSREIDSGPNTVAIKIKGREVYVKVYDERLLRALRKASKDDTGAIEQFINSTVGPFTQILRATLTQYNPVFAAVNAVRDFQSGGVAVLDELGAKGVALYTKHYRAALAASGRHITDSLGTSGRRIKTAGLKFGDPVMDRYFEEYRAAGGTTGGYYGKSAEDVQQEIRNVLLAAGASPKTAWEKIKTGGGTTAGRGIMRGVQSTGKVLEFLGAASENAARVAAYRAAREMGKSPAEAASIAKNLTTNFNRKGEWGQALNGAFLFFNAAVQGSHRTLKALKRGRVQSLMAGMTAVGISSVMLALAVGGDDEDDGQPYWDKIPTFEKERNFIIMLPPGADVDGVSQVGTNGRYIKIPMPYGFNVFTVLGVQIADVIRNAKDETQGVSVAQGSINMLNAIMGSFNPFGGAISLENDKMASSVLQAVMPTVGDIIVQQTLGVDGFSRKTSPYKGEFDNDPDSENVNANQSGGAWHMLARMLNAGTGGSQAEPGLIDVSPGAIQNLWKNLTGGTGTFLSDVFVNLPTKMLQEEAEITARDVPLLRNFYGQVDGMNDQSLLYERRSEIQRAKAYAKNREDLDMEPSDDPMQAALVSLSTLANKYTKKMSKLRREEIDIADDDEMTTAEKNIRKRELKLERESLAREFNAAYMDAMRSVRDGDFDQ